jgi:hypothetical protein
MPLLILKKGFESDPDLNPQIPQKRSVTVVTIHAERINAQKNCKEFFCAKSRPNLRNFGQFWVLFTWQQFLPQKGPKSLIFESQLLDP